MAQVKVLTKRIAVPRTSIGSDGTYEDLSASRNGVLKYEVMSGASDVKNFRDGDDFYPFDGKKDDSFQNEVFPEQDEFSYMSDARKARIERRNARSAAKTNEINSRADLNRGLSGDKQSDIEMAKALQDKEGEKKGLSTGAIIGIAVGGLALIAVIIVIAKRKSASKGK